jgi:hypothetical protein
MSKGPLKSSVRAPGASIPSAAPSGHSAEAPTKTRDAWYTFNEAKLEEVCTTKAWLQE